MKQKIKKKEKYETKRDRITSECLTDSRSLA